jgi:hypothetical protein
VSFFRRRVSHPTLSQTIALQALGPGSVPDLPVPHATPLGVAKIPCINAPSRSRQSHMGIAEAAKKGPPPPLGSAVYSRAGSEMRIGSAVKFCLRSRFRVSERTEFTDTRMFAFQLSLDSWFWRISSVRSTLVLMRNCVRFAQKRSFAALQNSTTDAFLGALLLVLFRLPLGKR